MCPTLNRDTYLPDEMHAWIIEQLPLYIYLDWMYSFIVHWHTDVETNRRFVLLFCIANSSRLPPATNLCSKFNLIQIRCHCHLTFVRFISVFSTNLFIFGFHVSLIVHFIDNRFNCWKIDQIIEWYALLLLFLSATGWVNNKTFSFLPLHFVTTHLRGLVTARHTCSHSLQPHSRDGAVLGFSKTTRVFCCRWELFFSRQF